MTSLAKQFIEEIQLKYKYSKSRLDDQYNMIIATDAGREKIIPCATLKKFYEEYRLTSADRQKTIANIIVYITNLAKDI